MSKGAGTTRSSSAANPTGVGSVAMEVTGGGDVFQKISGSNLTLQQSNSSKYTAQDLHNAIYSAGGYEKRTDNVEELLKKFPTGSQITVKMGNETITYRKVEAEPFRPDWIYKHPDGKEYGYRNYALSMEFVDRKAKVINVK